MENILTIFFFSEDNSLMERMQNLVSSKLADKTLRSSEDLFEDCILFRIPKDEEAYHMIIDDISEQSLGVLSAQISHGEEEFPISNTKIIAKSWTWVSREFQEDIVPETYYEFFLNKKLIEKIPQRETQAV